MQFLMLNNELITDESINAYEFRIYTYLLSLFNKSKDCSFPSCETISHKLKISLSTIKRSIKKLVELGYMSISKKKSIKGNYNTYKDFKYLINNNDSNKENVDNKYNPNKENKESNKKQELNFNNNETPLKTIIVRDCKEQGEQIHIDEICPYSLQHQQKISVVLKYGIRITKKQEFLLNEFDLDLLREALYSFKKSNGKSFSFLIDKYYDKCSAIGETPSESIQRYHGKFIMSKLNPMDELAQILI